MTSRERRYAAVLFDCDGVLVDSEPITNSVLREMLAELGWHLTAEECMARFVGKALNDELGQIAEHTGVIVSDEWIHTFRQRRNVALSERLIAVDGAVEAVTDVANLYGDRFAVASGADLGKVRLQLGKVGLLDFFEGRMFSGMDTAHSKPEPDVYLLAARTLGVDPTECAIVEDTPTGVRAGVAAGATVIGYVSGLDPATIDSLTSVGASTIIGDMRQLVALL